MIPITIHKQWNRICIVLMSLVLVGVILFLDYKASGVMPFSSEIGYVSRLFDNTKVHQIELVIDDWETFLDTATEEKYSPCTIIIDGEAFFRVGLRAK